MTAAKLAFALLLLLPFAAHAQDRPATTRRPRVIQLSPIDIPGRVQRPVFLVVERESPDTSPLPQQTSFVREIVRDAPR